MYNLLNSTFFLFFKKRLSSSLLLPITQLTYLLTPTLSMPSGSVYSFTFFLMGIGSRLRLLETVCYTSIHRHTFVDVSMYDTFLYQWLLRWEAAVILSCRRPLWKGQKRQTCSTSLWFYKACEPCRRDTVLCSPASPPKFPRIFSENNWVYSRCLF